MSTHQVLRQPAYQQLADELRAEIVSGRLRPGDRLPTEPQLCVSSGLSRSTVREALRLLASQHLITTTRGVTGGSFVAQPDPDAFAQSLSTGLRLLLATGPVAVRQILEVRELIEVPAAGLAAIRASAADLSALHAGLFDPETADLNHILAAQRTFHAALTSAAGNPVLRLIAQPLYAVTNERELALRAPVGFWAMVDREHRAIMDAVAARDVEAARAAAEGHLRSIAKAHQNVAEADDPATMARIG